jgi:DNA-directed RNA polymerase specialized sigma24 family protein
MEWGLLETTYLDEFGAIAPDVYAAACRIWQRSKDYGARVLIDKDVARIRTLMLKAAARVTRARDEKSHEIKELDGYLFQTFKHIILSELENDNNRLRFETKACLDAEWQDQANNVEHRILLNELVEAMDEWTRQIFEWLTLDYTFEDIARHLGLDSRVVRTKYNRHLTRLMKQITARTGVLGSRARKS